MKENKPKGSKLNINISKTERLHSPYKDSTIRTIADDSKAIIFMPEDQIHSIFKKDKKKKKIIAVDKNTRDVSHIKDKIKSKLSVPLLLPTNISQLKGLIDKSSGIVHHKSVPALGQPIEKPPSFAASEQNLLLRTMQPEPSKLERENLNKSNNQDIESLAKWFDQMKRSCSSEEEFEVVFKVCVKEVIRQVSAHCKLRGKLLKEILNYQPNFYMKKIRNIEYEFESYKKSQIKIMQGINEEFKLREGSLEEENSGLKNQIIQFEAAKKEDEESLISLKTEINNLNRLRSEVERKWKLRAETYLKDLNKVKKDLYRSTCKLANFISRNEVSELGKSLFTLNSLSREDKLEVQKVSKCLENYEIEIINLFRDFKTAQENSNLSVEVSGSDFNDSIKDKKEADSNSMLRRNSENENSYKDVFSQSPGLTQNLHKTKSDVCINDCSPVILPHSKSFSLASNPDKYSKSYDERAEEAYSSNAESLEQYYNFTDEEDNNKAEQDPTKMIPLKPIEIEIYEAASELEESRFSIIESKVHENISLTGLEAEKSVIKITQFTQTETHENSEDLILNIKKLITKGDIFESKETVKAIKEALNISKTNEVSSFTNSIDLECEKTDNGTVKINSTGEIDELQSEETSKTNEDLKTSSLIQDLTQAAKSEKIAEGRVCVIRKSFSRTEDVKSPYDQAGRKKTKDFNIHSPRKYLEIKKPNPGQGLLEKFLKKSINKIKMRATFSRKNINKILLGVYFEGFQRLQSEGEFNLIDIAYNEIASKFATKAAGEKKFLEFFASIVANSEFKRCSMFLKINGFGSLVKSGNYSKLSTAMYLNILQFIFSSKVGIFVGNEDDDRVMIPSVRIIESVKEKIEIYDKSLTQEFLARAEKMSIPDPMKINPGGVVELEAVLEYLMDSYEAYSSGICAGLSICLKGLAYETFGLISWVDIQMILRFIYKPYANFNKDLMFEELLVVFIKLNYCSENDILKTLELGKDVCEVARRELEGFKRMVCGLSREEKSSHSIQTFKDRVEVLERMIYDNTEACLVGIEIQKLEIERLQRI